MMGEQRNFEGFGLRKREGGVQSDWVVWVETTNEGFGSRKVLFIQPYQRTEFSA